jgi:hypothetical protein
MQTTDDWNPTPSSIEARGELHAVHQNGRFMPACSDGREAEAEGVKFEAPTCEVCKALAGKGGVFGPGVVVYGG